MDYQLQLDKEKTEHQYRTKKWEIAWDKGCFGLALAVVGAVALLLNNCAIERYKLNESRDRFLMDKRLEALTDISAAISDVTGAFFTYTKEKKDAKPAEAYREYDHALEKARDTVNKHLVLLDKEFDADVSRYIQIHPSFRDVGVTKCEQYRDFASDLENEFTDLCRARLNSGSNPVGVRMSLLPITFEERDRTASEDYLKKNFAAWQERKKNQVKGR